MYHIGSYQTTRTDFIGKLFDKLYVNMHRPGASVVCSCRNGGGYTWTAWLENNGFSVTLLNEQTPSAEVLLVLQSLIQRHNIQLIHTHFGLYHKLLVQNAAKLGVKVLVHDHMDFSPEGNIQKQKLRTLMLSAAYRMRGIHVVSVMELKSKSYLLCGKKYSHYVPNGLSFRRNVPAEVTREEAAKS